MTKEPRVKRWVKPTTQAKKGMAQINKRMAERKAQLAELRKRRAIMIKERENLIADLREACIAEVHGSNMTYAQVHAQNGPTVATLKAWEKKKSRLPQLATARMILRAVGKDLGIVSYAA